MKKIFATLLLCLACLPVSADETETEILKKAYPWIYAGEKAFKYETVSIDEIHAFCLKHQGELAFWYEEYKKRFGEVSDRTIPKDKQRPENGLMSGVRELTQINVTFYINKRASEGWKTVGTSSDFFVFEKRSEAENNKHNKSEMATPRKPSD
jgi:hypothetical protein